LHNSQEIAENIFTVQEVVDEIKSNRQLKALAVLPYNLEVKQPDSESIKAITEFAKKTGDFATLSSTDINVLALTYEFEKRFVGVEHLKKEPTVAKTVYTSGTSNGAANIAGFYNPEESFSKRQDEEIQEEEEESGSDEEEDEDSDKESEDETESNEINDEELIKKFGTLGFNTVANTVSSGSEKVT
jgi:RNA-binding protein NOB1